MTAAPSLKLVLGKTVLAQAVAATRHVVKLEGRLTLELLHKVTMPVQAALKRRQGARPCAAFLGRPGFHLLLDAPRVLHHAAHRNAPTG